MIARGNIFSDLTLVCETAARKYNDINPYGNGTLHTRYDDSVSYLHKESLT